MLSIKEPLFLTKRLQMFGNACMYAGNFSNRRALFQRHASLEDIPQVNNDGIKNVVFSKFTHIHGYGSQYLICYIRICREKAKTTCLSFSKNKK